MKKKFIFNLLLIICFLIIFNVISPSAQANVWISPMKMLAEGNLRVKSVQKDFSVTFKATSCNAKLTTKVEIGTATYNSVAVK